METIAIEPSEILCGSPLLHQADLSEEWFTEHLKEHPGFSFLTAKEMRFCAVLMETWEDDCTFDEQAMLEIFITQGWQDEIIPLISRWATLMRRLALKKRGLTVCQDYSLEAMTPMVEAFNEMMTVAASDFTTSYDRGEPNYCLLQQAVGVYRVWTRRVCEMAWRAMPDRDWSDLKSCVTSQGILHLTRYRGAGNHPGVSRLGGRRKGRITCVPFSLSPERSRSAWEKKRETPWSGVSRLGIHRVHFVGPERVGCLNSR